MSIEYNSTHSCTNLYIRSNTNISNDKFICISGLAMDLVRALYTLPSKATGSKVAVKFTSFHLRYNESTTIVPTFYLIYIFSLILLGLHCQRTNAEWWEKGIPPYHCCTSFYTKFSLKIYFVFYTFSYSK